MTTTPPINEIKRCRLCAPHLPHTPRPIFQLHPDAVILLAGQAPGRQAHASGLPFNDASGRRLMAWLNVTAERFYDPTVIAILPMAFCYPGKATSGDRAPRRECAEHWRQRLLACLPKLRLTVLIGHYAQQWHLQHGRKNKLTETVKAWRHYWPETVPIPHPSPRNNGWLQRNPWFETELLPHLQQRTAELLNSRDS